MMALLWLLPITLALGLAGVGVFVWSVRSGQFEDLDAAAYRILDDDQPPAGPAFGPRAVRGGAGADRGMLERGIPRDPAPPKKPTAVCV